MCFILCLLTNVKFFYPLWTRRDLPPFPQGVESEMLTAYTTGPETTGGLKNEQTKKRKSKMIALFGHPEGSRYVRRISDLSEVYRRFCVLSKTKIKRGAIMM